MMARILADIELARIDYGVILASATPEERRNMAGFLSVVLPQEWLYSYSEISPQQHNVHEIQVDGFDYLWDLSYELVTKGVIPKDMYVDDRVVAAHGRSQKANKPRNDTRLRGYSRGPIEFVPEGSDSSEVDRGHLIGHASGGALDLNIIPQLRSMNRGGEWRKMENYCGSNPGTYFFCRPIYLGYSRHPAEIEFGILMPEDSLWLRRFRNYRNLVELEEIEVVWLEKLKSIVAGETSGKPADAPQ